MADRHTVETITSDALNALYEQLAVAEETESQRQLAAAREAVASATIRAASAEASLERMVERLAAAIGQAYLDGKLPPHPTLVSEVSGPLRDVAEDIAAPKPRWKQPQNPPRLRSTWSAPAPNAPRNSFRWRTRRPTGPRPSGPQRRPPSRAYADCAR